MASLAVVGGFLQLRSSNPFVPGVGVLIGLGFFALAIYGRVPLVPTVRDWQPPASLDSIDETQRRGLRALRYRKWLMWASIPGMFVVFFGVMVSGPSERSFLVASGLGLIVGTVGSLLYFNSRCPRCGNAFFMAPGRPFNKWRNRCAHCRLPLDADKVPKDS